MKSSDNSKETSVVNKFQIGDTYSYRELMRINPDSDIDKILNKIVKILGLPEEEMLDITGKIIYNDGETFIVRVSHMFEELRCYILHYDEVKRYFPSFTDCFPDRFSEYLCMSVKAEEPLFFVDIADGTIYPAIIDEDDFFWGYDIPDHMEQGATEEQERDLLIKANDFLERIQNQQMISECDMGQLIHDGLLVESPTLRSSINRCVEWIVSRDCAILTTWRGEKHRRENDRDNSDLQKLLRDKGFGVIKVRGCYIGTDKQVSKEHSYLVYDMTGDGDAFYDAVYEQSEKYGQDCFLYKTAGTDNEAFLIGTNEEWKRQNGERKSVGYLHVNTPSSEYTQIGPGWITFECNKCDEA